MDGCGDVSCALCGADNEVVLPQRIVDDCHSGRLILFVGGGASTEVHNAGGSFYDRVRDELGVNDDLAFPDLMSMYVARHSRNELVENFLAYFMYKKSFPVLNERISEFHSRLSMNPLLQKIITTNWDDLFEKVAEATPLVVGDDFAFWDSPIRKVLKIHGSILNPGTIIATRDEYNRSLDALKSGQLGATTRHLMATGTVVFVGYSYRDDDIKQVIDALRADLGTAARPCYFVHPDTTFEPPIAGAEVIHTSARHFIKLLDDALVAQEVLLPRTVYQRVERLMERHYGARDRSYKLEIQDHPLEVYDLSFREGLRDAYGRILAQKHIGRDRLHGELHQRIRMYDDWLKRANKARDYWNASYIEGYLTGLISTVIDCRIDVVPMYFCPGHGPDSSFARVAKAIKAGPRQHKAAFNWARREAERVPRGIPSRAVSARLSLIDDSTNPYCAARYALESTEPGRISGDELA